MSKSSEPIWARAEPGARRPRHSREQIAAAALAVADSEGIEAVSMRRVAEELGAGTMTLYHYVRTKAELLDLMDDTIMAEVIVPDDELSANWREALTAIATRSHAAFVRHPWALQGLRDARGGPNGMKHLEQTIGAVARLGLPFPQQLEIALVVDDYVFGYVLRSAQDTHRKDMDERALAMAPYIGTLLETGEYPHVDALLGRDDILGSITKMMEVFRDPGRFGRGLERLMDGLELALQRAHAIPAAD